MDHAQSNGIGLRRPTDALDWALNLKDVHEHAAGSRQHDGVELVTPSSSTHTKFSGSRSNILDPVLDSVLVLVFIPPPPLGPATPGTRGTPPGSKLGGNWPCSHSYLQSVPHNILEHSRHVHTYIVSISTGLGSNPKMISHIQFT